MKASLTKSVLTGVLTTVFCVGVSAAMAAEPQLANQINTALSKKNLAEVQNILKGGPKNVDEVLKALLKKTQKDMSVDPEFSGKMMSIAGQFAPQMTPPTVPAVCADLRRIVESLKPEQAESPLFKAVMSATESFSKAPVVVAAGRPNECEQAWLQMNKMGEEALLAMTPGMRGPGLPPVTVRPGVPPTTPSPEDKPSAD